MKKLTIVLMGLLLVAASYRLNAQVSSDRILHAADEPQNWLTYSGTYTSQRYSLLKQLDDLMIEEENTLRVQPCFSPVWDTALALNTLAATGVPPDCEPAVDECSHNAQASPRASGPLDGPEHVGRRWK